MVKLLVVLFSLFMCAFSHEAKGSYYDASAMKRDTSKLVRDVSDFQTSIEITQSFNGTLGIRETQYYMISLAAHEVADIVFKCTHYFTTFELTAQGTTYSRSFYSSLGTDAQPVTLAYHCPEYPYVYYIQLQADDDVSFGQLTNFTLEMTKRSANLPAGASATGDLQFIDNGYIGFPVTGTCQQLLLDVNFSISISYYNVELSYMCRDYTSSEASACKNAGLPVQNINQGYSADTSHYQFLVNCSAAGNYYLNFYTSSPTQYNATWHTGYPCPSGCWNFGTCNLSTGTCMCRPGSTDPMCHSSKRALPPSNTSIPLPIDGSTFNYTVSMQKSGQNMFKIDNSISSTQTIRVTFLVEPGPFLWNYFYLNPMYPASSTNATGGVTFGPNYIGTYTEVKLCAGSGPWYMYAYTISNVNISITVSYVDIQVLSSGTFNGAITSPTASSYTPVVYMFQPSNTAVVIQVNETSPVLYGMYLLPTCGVFVSSEISLYTLNPISYDTNFGYQRYQVYSTNVLPTKTYYLMVMGTPGANFTGAVSFSQTRLSCSTSCSGVSQGYCDSTSGNCICRYGYTGSNCSQTDFPVGAKQLQVGYNSIHLSDGSFYATVNYAVFPIIPIGYSMILTASSTTAADVFISTSFPFASPETALFKLDSAGGKAYYTFTNCVARAPSQYYISVAGTNATAGDVNLTISLTQPAIPSDGTRTQVSVVDGTTPFISHLPPSCEKAYYILIEGNSLQNTYVGEGDQTACMDVSRKLAIDIGNDTYNAFGYVLSITNCSNSIELQITASSADIATVTISPTTPCPNDCNGHGFCYLGGICKCTYPFMGTDCGTYDTICPAIPDDQGATCPSLAPSIYGNTLFGFNDPYCYIQDALYDVKQRLASFSATISNAHVSTSCKDEMRQILCDYTKLKCQSQPGGGVKLMLPCNSMSWTSRCVSSDLAGSFSYLDSVIADINTNIASAPGFYICNPSPFNYSLYPTSAPSTPSPSLAPTVTVGEASITTGPHSSASHFSFFLPLFVLALLSLAFVI